MDNYDLSPLNLPRLSVFFEEVASQSGLRVQEQHFLYLGHDLPLEGNMKVVNLPHTSPARPLILLSNGPESKSSLPFRERKTNTHIHTHAFLKCLSKFKNVDTRNKLI